MQRWVRAEVRWWLRWWESPVRCCGMKSPSASSSSSLVKSKSSRSPLVKSPTSFGCLLEPTALLRLAYDYGEGFKRDCGTDLF
jgi:hypothetical protein